LGSLSAAIFQILVKYPEKQEVLVIIIQETARILGHLRIE